MCVQKGAQYFICNDLNANKTHSLNKWIYMYGFALLCPVKLLRYYRYSVKHHSLKINQSFHFRKYFTVYNLLIILTPCSLCFLITVDLLILLENAKLLDHGNILNNLYCVLFPTFSFSLGYCLNSWLFQ